MGELRGQALAIKRFDRTPDGPVHIEDFAQVFGVLPDHKYDKGNYRMIGRVLGIETGTADVAEFIRRLVFSTLIGNGDTHLKNWSLIYLDRRTPALCPAYDLLSTIPYVEGEDTAALNFSRTKKMAALSKDELAHLAAKAQLSEKLVIDPARETVVVSGRYARRKRRICQWQPRWPTRSIRTHRRSSFIANLRSSRPLPLGIQHIESCCISMRKMAVVSNPIKAVTIAWRPNAG